MRSSVVIFFASFLLPSLVGCASSPAEGDTTSKDGLTGEFESSDVAKLYARGNELFDAEQHRDALRFYNRVLELNPEHIDALCNAGLCYRLLGFPEKAVESYERALRFAPVDMTILQNYVIALQSAGMYERTLAPLDTLMKNAPDDLALRSSLAQTYFALKRYADAIPVYEKVLRADPGHAQDYYNLGLCHYELNDNDRALSMWLTALAHDPKNEAVNKGLAVLYWRRAEYVQAWNAVRTCQSLSIPLSAEFLTQLQLDSGQLGPDTP
ncbi:MAG: tetratricopeptide repeat protein [Candidatus Hydrogenedentota bacterium]